MCEAMPCAKSCPLTLGEIEAAKTDYNEGFYTHHV